MVSLPCKPFDEFANQVSQRVYETEGEQNEFKEKFKEWAEKEECLVEDGSWASKDCGGILKLFQVNGEYPYGPWCWWAGFWTEFESPPNNFPVTEKLVSMAQNLGANFSEMTYLKQNLNGLKVV